MVLALTPHGGPPRLIRFCKKAGPPLISTLDKVNNLLHIEQVTYDSLTPAQQDEVLRTHHHILYLFEGAVKHDDTVT